MARLQKHEVVVFSHVESSRLTVLFINPLRLRSLESMPTQGQDSLPLQMMPCKSENSSKQTMQTRWRAGSFCSSMARQFWSHYVRSLHSERGGQWPKSLVGRFLGWAANQTSIFPRLLASFFLSSASWGRWLYGENTGCLIPLRPCPTDLSWLFVACQHAGKVEDAKYHSHKASSTLSLFAFQWNMDGLGKLSTCRCRVLH